MCVLHSHACNKCVCAEHVCILRDVHAPEVHCLSTITEGLDAVEENSEGAEAGIVFSWQQSRTKSDAKSHTETEEDTANGHEVLRRSSGPLGYRERCKWMTLTCSKSKKGQM